MEFEAQGLPTVVVTTEKFAALTSKVANAYGLAKTRVSVVPHPLGGTPEAAIRDWADGAVDRIVGLYCGRKGA